MHDPDKAPTPTEPLKLETTPIGFQHPPGFEAAAFFIVAMDKDSHIFTNMPFTQPHLCLFLATKGLDMAAELAVKQMQAALVAKSPILKVPPGTQIPPWAGP